MLLEATKENASELHRSASAPNSKDNNGIDNSYHTLSCSFLGKTLSVHLKSFAYLSLLFIVDPVRALWVLQAIGNQDQCQMDEIANIDEIH